MIRWGTYERGARLGDVDHRILIQRLRCNVCGRTHSLLPDFLHPYRHYVIRLLQSVVSLYLITGLGVGRRLMSHLPCPGPVRSTVREWVASFAYGAGELLLDLLSRQLLKLAPLANLPDTPPPRHLDRVRDPVKRRRMERAHRFWLLAELCNLVALCSGQGQTTPSALYGGSIASLYAPLAAKPGRSAAHLLVASSIHHAHQPILSFLCSSRQ